MIRKLSFIFTLFAFTAALGFVLAACELEEDSDTDAAVSGTDTNTAGTDTNVDGPQLRFVRIDDNSDGGGENPGADIDAIVLIKPGGAESYAENVESSFAGGGDPIAVDPMDALGPPDAFYNWSTGDTTVCDANDGFFTTGGSGGQLIVRMAQVMDPGDTLTVLEVGNCQYDESDPDAIAGIDPIDVYVSVANDPAGSWITVGSGTGPEITFPVPALP